MGLINEKTNARLKRKKRIRKKIFGTSERPRLSIFRSTRHIYAQIIEDTTGRTLVAASTVEKTVRERSKFEDKKSAANYIGKLLAQRAVEKGISKVIFDRNGFLYHGRVKALSAGAREGGLEF